MPTYAFETYDVFTDQKFSGNQLAIVTDARGLTTAQMQAITREFNVAETSFVLPPENPANTAHVRIFTPGYEMPYAGHPTIGTAVAIARARKITDEVRFELKAGLFPVRLEIEGEKAFAEFQNPNAPHETGAAPDADILEAALSLPKGAIDRANHRPRRIGAGIDYIVCRTSLEDARTAFVDSAAWRDLDMENIVGVYLYAGGAEGADYHVRMFAPDAGVMEDPATGSAAATLPGHLALSGELDDGEHNWVLEQGIELGRPSRLFVRAQVKSGAVQTIFVGGNAVPVQRGELFVDD